jgi:CHC2 zinc finger
MSNVLELIKFQKPIRVKDNGYKVYFCPYCDDETGHLHLNLKKNFYHCFKCSTNGKINSFGWSGKGPVFYADQYKDKQHLDGKIDTLDFNDLMKTLNFRDLNHDYKGVTEQLIYNSMKNRGLTVDEMRRYDLSVTDDYPYTGRAILFWRPLEESSPKYLIARQVCSPPPKYLNPMVVKDFLWTTFYIDQVPKSAVLVEGTFDAITLSRYGYPAMGLLGKTLGKKQLDFLFDLQEKGLKEIKIMLDRPGFRKYKITEGRKRALPNEVDATMILYNKLKDYFKVKPIFLEHAHDPDSASEDYIVELLGDPK